MRPKHRLNALNVRQLNAPGRYADGDGLYLQIDDSGGKSWIFMWKRGGRRRVMGLGPVRRVSLADAREVAKNADSFVRQGRDPIAERRKGRAGVMSFGEAMEKCFDDIKRGWRNDRHRVEWRQSLLTHAKLLLSKAASEITTEDVVRALSPIWLDKAETAVRVRGRIERVLDWAKSVEQWEGENPARWKSLKDRLPRQPRKRQRVKHHPALPYDEIGAFMTKLRVEQGVAARALEFLILVAARLGEMFGAQWEEINFEQKLWTVPAHRMKGGIVHVVPLSDRALAILRGQAAVASSPFVFPGFRTGRPLTYVALRSVMARLAVNPERASIHGFRSTFRDWAGDRTPFHREAEIALAHTIGDETERAYRRGTAMDKRRELMAAWASYCEVQPGDVVWLRREGSRSSCGDHALRAAAGAGK